MGVNANSIIRASTFSRFMSCSSASPWAIPVDKRTSSSAGIVPVLEAHDVIVSETQDDHLAARPPTPPPIGPQVEHIVEVHVREQR